jgi:hypothetical protein
MSISVNFSPKTNDGSTGIQNNTITQTDSANHSFQTQGEWVSSSMFVRLYGGSYSTSWVAFKFNTDGTYTEYHKQHNAGESLLMPTESEVLQATTDKHMGTYTGSIPLLDKLQQLEPTRDKINAQEQELYQVYGSNIESLQSNYQSTMMAGLVVAMLGTTVLFFTFRQL